MLSMLLREVNELLWQRGRIYLLITAEQARKYNLLFFPTYRFEHRNVYILEALVPVTVWYNQKLSFY